MNNALENKTIVDVREKDEFEAERPVGAIHLPLSQLEQLAATRLGGLRGQKVTVICRSGKRAQMAKAVLARMNPTKDIECEVFEGGLQRWKQQGLPTEGALLGSRRLPIMRQVQLVAGGLAASGAVAALFVNSAFAWVPAFVGMGLLVAGATGTCMLAQILAHMPWNRGAGTGKDVSTCTM